MKLKEYIDREIKTSARESLLRVAAKILLDPSSNAVYLIRRAQLTKSTVLRWYYRRKLVLRYGIFIGNNVRIGVGLRVGHPSSIIIGNGVVIGENCTLYQQTTLGIRNVGKNEYPIIGDNVTIYAGAKIIGGIHIGNNVDVAANAVVTKSCGNNCVLKGVPARCSERKSCI